MRLFFAVALFSFIGLRSVQAAEVIDLGSLEVKGKMRGPEVQVIDSGRLNEEAAEHMIRAQLKSLEERLLDESEPTASSKHSRGNKR